MTLTAPRPTPTTGGDLLYEGKAKRVFSTGDPSLYLVQYKDDATAFNGEKRATVGGKGELNNRISALFMRMLRSHGIATHFVEQISATEQLVRAVQIVPLEVVVRNIVAGSLSKRLGLDEGTPLARPIVEFSYKRDDLGDPLLTRAHIDALGIADADLVDAMQRHALRVDEILSTELSARKIVLVDFKLEYGLTAEGELLLADEISPDTCRFWDATSQRKLDKDRFRRDMGGVIEAYQEILERLTEEPS